MEQLQLRQVKLMHVLTVLREVLVKSLVLHLTIKLVHLVISVKLELLALYLEILLKEVEGVQLENFVPKDLMHPRLVLQENIVIEVDYLNLQVIVKLDIIDLEVQPSKIQEEPMEMYALQEVIVLKEVVPLLNALLELIEM